MLYSKAVSLFDELASTTKKLEKRDLIANFLKEVDEQDLPFFTLSILGRIFPLGDEREAGVAGQLMIRAISLSFGSSEQDVVNKFKELGDIGLVSEHFATNKKQVTLMSHFGGKSKSLDIHKVFENIQSLPQIEGSRSQEKKLDLIKELLINSSPQEARYITRMILGEMRIGVAEGILRDAIAMAFDVSPEEVEGAYDIYTDYGRVAVISKNQGSQGLSQAKITVGSPIRCMLADKANDLREAIEKYENVCIEKKYDGFRVQIHKSDSVKIYSRRLEDVTKQFPEIVEWAGQSIDSNDCIIEGEVLAIDRDGRPRAFQSLSQRIQRKYDIDQMVKKIPVQVNLFDMIYVDGKNIMKEPLSFRWSELSKLVRQTDSFKLADHIETKNFEEANEFYQQSLDEGQEGVMVKNLEAVYQPGKRVGFWLKVKEILEPLDLIIVKGRWGEGKRSKWISSLVLACRDDDGNLHETAMLGTGLTEEQLEELTQKLKGMVQKEDGLWLVFRPEIVVEIGYEEIQKSPHYPTGLALRFPRLLRFRPDKSVKDIENVSRVESLYNQQNGPEW